uniref:Uncharacterized protein TCIL3000_11_15980 n=1 Tax=Trypanosoma congolense (strain IL3000) TaxID=1068625 RepID=G0V365_TRYCI|nr:unnamed protein product [Trypanosoma congolense IL3000]
MFLCARSSRGAATVHYYSRLWPGCDQQFTWRPPSSVCACVRRNMCDPICLLACGLRDRWVCWKWKLAGYPWHRLDEAAATRGPCGKIRGDTSQSTAGPHTCGQCKRGQRELFGVVVPHVFSCGGASRARRRGAGEGVHLLFWHSVALLFFIPYRFPLEGALLVCYRCGCEVCASDRWDGQTILLSFSFFDLYRHMVTSSRDRIVL